jgi:hypothetical protein
VDRDDEVPVLDIHLEHALVAEDARVVDEDVDPAEAVDRRLHYLLGAVPLGDAVVVRHRLAARRLDLVADLLCGSGVRSLAFHRAAEVVYYNLRSTARKKKGVSAAEASAGPGNNRNSIIKPYVSHTPSPFTDNP